jgi:hypothetical protein
LNIEFKRGILTGYNDAFILDEVKANDLTLKNPKNLELIKPILRGRDTRKYYCNFADTYMICSFPALKINIEDYQEIKEHLLSFGIERLKQSGEFNSRKKTPHKWYETQDTTAYHFEFIKPKIIFSEIVSEPQFYYDELGYYPEATVFIITGDNLKYLTALLNSKAVTFFFRTFYMGGELVGKIRYKKAFVENIPIPDPSDIVKNRIEVLVDQIIELKKQDQDTTAMEEEIDQMVYDLYGLTDEEIKVVEGIVN